MTKRRRQSLARLEARVAEAERRYTIAPKGMRHQRLAELKIARTEALEAYVRACLEAA